MYEKVFKRLFDIVLSLTALIVLSPVLLVLAVVGAIVMKGTPFFTQPRPGRIDPKTGKEKIFRMIKFRSMTCEKDKDGKLLPDEKRLTGYGKKLRSTSLDELPELINVLIGQMSLVGPRPLLVEYIPRYSEEQRHRHDVRPGITGWAQVNGRNAIGWEEKFKYDVEYVRNISLKLDIKIPVLAVTDEITDIGEIAEREGFGVKVTTGKTEDFVKAIDKLSQMDGFNSDMILEDYMGAASINPIFSELIEKAKAAIREKRYAVCQATSKRPQ